MRSTHLVLALLLIVGCGGPQNQSEPAAAMATSEKTAANEPVSQPAPPPRQPAPRAAEPPRTDPAVLAKLEEMDQRLAEIEKRLDNMPARPSGQRPRVLRPDPAKVYAVPIDGAPSRGPTHAKVTMVMGFEFA